MRPNDPIASAENITVGRVSTRRARKVKSLSLTSVEEVHPRRETIISILNQWHFRALYRVFWDFTDLFSCHCGSEKVSSVFWGHCAFVVWGHTTHLVWWCVVRAPPTQVSWYCWSPSTGHPSSTDIALAILWEPWSGRGLLWVRCMTQGLKWQENHGHCRSLLQPWENWRIFREKKSIVNSDIEYAKRVENKVSPTDFGEQTHKSICINDCCCKTYGTLVEQ